MRFTHSRQAYARLPLFLLIGLLALPCAAAQASPIATGKATHNSSSGIAAYAYVGTNTSGNGTGYVKQFIIANNGVSPSPIGSSVAGASGYLAVTSQFVFATDGKNIVTYSHNTALGLHQTSSVDGTAHNITPQDSLVGPLTLDHTGHTLYAAEINYDGSDDDAYTIWTVNSDGSLSYLGATGIDVDYNTYLAFSPNNQYAYGYGCYFANWDIFGFTRNSSGSLTSLDPQAEIPPGNGAMYCPADLAVSAMNFAAVAYSDISSPGSNYLLVTYAINSNGTLGLVANSEITAPFTAEHSMEFDPTGQYLAVAGDAGIQVYRLQATGTLTAVGSVVDGSVAFNVVRWDNSGHLYAISGSGLYVFNSAAGVLTQAPGSPLPVADAGSLAVLPAQ